MCDIAPVLRPFREWNFSSRFYVISAGPKARQWSCWQHWHEWSLVLKAEWISYQNTVINSSMANYNCHAYSCVGVAGGNLDLPRLAAASFVYFFSLWRNVIPRQQSVKPLRGKCNSWGCRRAFITTRNRFDIFVGLWRNGTGKRVARWWFRSSTLLHRITG